ncbi:sensor domain-containing diguanylate cyclase [Ferrimonas senticii]|uniref:sensor domain-containing diguanylate cyclase n=1 Tax=Ferrimonas senticii TaxID=394566 RepID=UPI000401FC9B|nr:sensor domain-containing diguanylate cyclase [Ferrimonas senticii]
MADTQTQRELTGLLIRIAEYPALTGLAEIKQRLKAMMARDNSQLSVAADAFLTGIEHDRHGRLEQAIEQFQHCAELHQSHELRLADLSHIYLGSIYGELGESFLAYHHYKQVLDRVADLDALPLAMLYTNLSDLFVQLKRHQEAVHYGRMACRASADAQSHQSRIIALINTGISLARLEQPAPALALMEQALAIACEHQVARTIGLVHSYYGMVLSQHCQGRQADAEHHYAAATHHLQEMAGNFDSLANRLHYTEFLLQHNRLDEALQDWPQLSSQVAALGCTELDHHLQRLDIERLRRLGADQQRLEAQQQFIATLEQERLASLHRESELLLNQVQRLERQQSQRIAQQVNDNLDVITEIGQLIATADKLEQQMPKVFADIQTIFNASEFGIALYDNNSNQLDYRYYIGEQGLLSPFVIDCAKVNNFGTHVIATRQTIHLSEVTDETLMAYSGQRGNSKSNPLYDDGALPQSVLLTPVILGNEVLGMLSVQAMATNQYQQHHRQLFEQLANLIAIALKNLRQRQDLQRSYQELERVSITDQLTQTYNRHHLKTLVPKLVNHCASSEQPLAIALVDIDHFKGLNDSLGHYAGDQALVAVAEAMRFCFNRQYDYLFRYGGDELLILATDIDQADFAAKLQQLQQLVASLAPRNPASPYQGRLTLSIGAVHCPQFANDTRLFNAAFETADQQLYQAKRAGRNGQRLTQFLQPATAAIAG